MHSNMPLSEVDSLRQSVDRRIYFSKMFESKNFGGAGGDDLGEDDDEPYADDAISPYTQIPFVRNLTAQNERTDHIINVCEYAQMNETSNKK